MARIIGSLRNNRLVGTSSGDRLYGRAGHDRLHGRSGNDWLYGQAGNDRLYGGGGHDRLYGNGGNDRLYGQSGNDIVNGGSGNDLVSGGSGNDRLYGGAGSDRLIGGVGNDLLFGGGGVDTAYFARNFANYSVQQVGGYLRVAGPDGVDLVAGDIEILRFADRMIDLRGNHVPVAASDGNVTSEDAVVAGASVLANDTDLDVALGRQTLTVTGAVAKRLGTAATLASGALVTMQADGTTFTIPMAASRASRGSNDHRHLHLRGLRWRGWNGDRHSDGDHHRDQ